MISTLAETLSKVRTWAVVEGDVDAILQQELGEVIQLPRLPSTLSLYRERSPAVIQDAVVAKALEICAGWAQEDLLDACSRRGDLLLCWDEAQSFQVREKQFGPSALVTEFWARASGRLSVADTCAVALQHGRRVIALVKFGEGDAARKRLTEVCAP